jgi:hypothetical protein
MHISLDFSCYACYVGGEMQEQVSMSKTISAVIMYSFDLNISKIVLLCSDEGKVRKVLKVEPLPDGSGFFFNLSNSLSS